jgi:hypothetical protein
MKGKEQKTNISTFISFVSWCVHNLDYVCRIIRWSVSDRFEIMFTVEVMAHFENIVGIWLQEIR